MEITTTTRLFFQRWLNRLLKPFMLSIFLVIIIIFLISKNGLYLPSIVEEFYISGDQRFYIQMADNIASVKTAPYCWRIAVPFLAGLFPLPQMGFLTITVFSFILSGIGLYLVARKLNYPGNLPAFGLLLFFSIDGVQFALFDFWLPDALAYSIIIFSILMIINRRDWIFMILVCVGVLVKESTLFVLPLYYSLTTNKLLDWKLLRKTLTLGTPAIITLFIIRILIPNDNESYKLIPLLIEMVPKHINNFSINDYLIRSFGISAVIPFLAPKKNMDLFIRFSPFLVAVISQLLFANDTYRLLALGSPILIILSLNSLSMANIEPIEENEHKT